jgi:glutamine synthetase adenylyltransferase
MEKVAQWELDFCSDHDIIFCVNNIGRQDGEALDNSRGSGGARISYCPPPPAAP